MTLLGHSINDTLLGKCPFWLKTSSYDTEKRFYASQSDAQCPYNFMAHLRDAKEA